jgi:hypothetical protein
LVTTDVPQAHTNMTTIVNRQSDVRSTGKLSRIALIAVALTLFLVIDFAIHVFGFYRVYRGVCLMSANTPRRGGRSRQVRAALGATVAVRAATLLYFRKQKDCLPKSLAAFCMLRMLWIDATFVIGIKRFPFAGHAWVECAGQLIDDTRERVTKYKVLSTV